MRTGDVMNIRIFKTADDLHDGIDFADVGEKFVAQTFALRRAFDEAGDIHEFDCGRNNDLRLGDLLQHFEPRIRHRDDADVRIDRAKRIIRRLRFAGAGDGVEQGGFSDIGQTDNSSFEHKFEKGGDSSENLEAIIFLQSASTASRISFLELFDTPFIKRRRNRHDRSLGNFPFKLL